MAAKSLYTDLMDEPQRISIEDYNKEIEEALMQVKAGNYITQEELEKEMEEW